MKTFLGKFSCILFISIITGHFSFAQQKVEINKTVSAGPEYKKNPFYQSLWGRNYRKEWITPVKFPVMQLDTLKGGFISYKEGGSNQSKSLHIKTSGDKEYALRSVDKSLLKVIPKIFQKTFVADIVNDEISMSHPYGALGVPIMADALKIPHSNPVYYYLPEQNALDTLSKKYAGKVYLFEQRPKGDWSNAPNLGSFSEFEDTDDMMKKILKDNDHSVDQSAFVRARLFDMLIADFDRHADQWKWGVRNEGSKTIYVPVPTDRDQAFFKHNGILLNLVISAAGLQFLQSYDDKIGNVKGYAFINRSADRWFTNKITLREWQSTAENIQQLLTDDVIERSIKGMPPEIFALSGNDLIAKMKSRRSHLKEYATEYYGLLAKQPEIIGTKGAEYFEINNDKDSTTVNIYNINKRGETENRAFYSRTFNAKETEELRIYGLSGNDVYKITGNEKPKICIRIIGGDQRDSIINLSAGKSNIEVYDNADNIFPANNKLKLHISNDTALHAYNYNSSYSLPDKKGFKPHIGFNDADRLYAGIRYEFVNHTWGKKPFASKQSIDVDFSLFQRALSTTYTGLFPKVFGQWDLSANANYDQERWINFFGLGNETVRLSKSINYYRMRSEETSVDAGLGRIFGNNSIRISGFYQRVKIKNDDSRFVAAKLAPFIPGIFKTDNFAGLQVAYNHANVKDSILPEKGHTFSLNAKHTQNFSASEKSFQQFDGNVQFFIPIVPKLSLAIKTGAATITGTPVFYQYPSIGESFDLRGFRRERFSGKSTFYNNTELRFIKNVRSYLFNGKAGLMAFMDNGRVWIPGEKSNTIHSAFGGGILLAPFNLISVAVTYGISKEEKILQFRLGILF